MAEPVVINVTTQIFNDTEKAAALATVADALATLSAASNSDAARAVPTAKVASSLTFPATQAVLDTVVGRLAIRQRIAAKLGLRMAYIVIPEDGIARRRRRLTDRSGVVLELDGDPVRGTDWGTSL